MEANIVICSQNTPTCKHELCTHAVPHKHDYTCTLFCDAVNNYTSCSNITQEVTYEEATIQ